MRRNTRRQKYSDESKIKAHISGQKTHPYRGDLMVWGAAHRLSEICRGKKTRTPDYLCSLGTMITTHLFDMVSEEDRIVTGAGLPFFQLRRVIDWIDGRIQGRCILISIDKVRIND
jgi:hypothetical protein